MTLSVRIDIATQVLQVYANGSVVKAYTVSTAKKGAGELFGSEQTPRGQHIVRAKIGKDAPINSVFVARRLTGEIYSPALRAQHPERDWILTRILWLSGIEIAKNRLGKVDTMRRFIYIHGTSDAEPMGAPMSHGCIRMGNQDVIELFDMLPVGTHVDIC
jgi:L,D-transpeptidase YbiS